MKTQMKVASRWGIALLGTLVTVCAAMALPAVAQKAKQATEIIVPKRLARVSQTIELRARLRSKGVNLNGKTLTFKVDGNSVGTATTDAGGVAKVSYTVPESVGVGAVKYSVEFAGDDTYQASSTVGGLSTFKDEVQMMIPDRRGHPGQTVDLRARLRRRDTIVLNGKTLTFKIDGFDAGTAMTAGTGVAVVAYKIPADMSVGKHKLTVTFDGDNLYQALTENRWLVVVEPPKKK